MPETMDGPRVVCWELPPDPAIVAKARAMVGETLLSWDLPDLLDDVVLAVAELLANAITHGRPPVRLSMEAAGGELRVQVTDHGAEWPRRLDLGVEAVHGRGLAIVQALAQRMGVLPLADGPGKTVWAGWLLPPR
ncbi:hypothetical protein Sme01_27560 [Sphaerisporangium melleum]|uniref:Histidine kinase/HSP90-like ATPase domain-containing protein n=1 Tax=Sphaerisporangium melleum TaxID=321316 RepID=A0A917VFH6_9ACTN|nr:ATP-binding protein [Sphaerisporangium melleum]GGK70524.1 hypothetical protein GCM10007964_11790 [Sphaerisporangium melleum]GII70280.1 hypothetical protein Sme01_27560 [Sphaerisporangium melleum]